MITKEHDHGEVDFSEPTTTNPDLRRVRDRSLRPHVIEFHDAGNGWAIGAGLDIVAEWHNLEHGRDAHGAAMTAEEVELFRGEAYKPKTIAVDAGGIGRVVTKASLAKRCVKCGAVIAEPVLVDEFERCEECADL